MPISRSKPTIFSMSGAASFNLRLFKASSMVFGDGFSIWR